MATTHSCDGEQCLVDLAFTADGPCQLTITVPTEPNLARPGWWMLTVVDTRRRPSHRALGAPDPVLTSRPQLRTSADTATGLRRLRDAAAVSMI